MANKVMGQTGKVVLSDATAQYNMGKKRTLRYRYEKCYHGYRAVVIGPFHSRTYGVCSFGTKRTTAKAALIRRLANDYRYIGNLIFSDVDDGDNVGNVDARVWDDRAKAFPIKCEV